MRLKPSCYLIATAVTLATLTAAHAGDYRTMEAETLSQQGQRREKGCCLQGQV